MKKYITTYILLLSTLVISCGEKDEVYPTGKDKNWYSVQDKPGELNQLLYKIYQETKCPIFYNDTIGQENLGIDHEGNPNIYYETLKIDYEITQYQHGCTYALPVDTSAIIASVHIMQDEVIPLLKANNLFPIGYLITDTVRTSRKDYIPDIAYRSTRATVIGVNVTFDKKVVNVKEMTAEQKKEWGARITSLQIENFLTVNYSKALDAYYKITNDDGKNHYEETIVFFSFLPKPHPIPESYGFLSFAYYEKTTSIGYNDQFPDQATDIQDFITLILTKKEASIKASYEKDWPKVWKKYVYLKDLLKQASIII